MREMRKLLSPHAKPKVSFPESKCSHRLCRPGTRSCGEYTQMRGTRKLKSSRTALHPIDRAQQSGKTVRNAGGQPARKQMLA